MSTEQIRGLRAAAYHEAGHAVAAERLVGGPTEIVITRKTNGDATWFAARCAHYAAETATAARTISLAGAVAEVLCGPSGGNSGDALFNAIVSRISVSDARGAGAYSRRDLDDCLTFVKSVWPAIEARAAREIQAFNDREAADVAALAPHLSHV